MSIVLVTGALAPYTQRLYEAFVDATGASMTVLVCEQREPQRQWVLPPPRNFRLEVLSGWRRHISYTRHLYVNPAVVPALRRLDPRVIVVEDFSPTMAMAALYARARRIPYGIKTDGHRGIDPGETSRVHRLMRRMLVPHARFGICASEDSVTFLEHWGLAKGRGVVVPIVVPWEPPVSVPGYEARPFDVLFAGAINEHIKGAMFFADVIAALQQRSTRRLNIRVAGDGPLRAELAERLSAAGVAAHFDGILQAAQMPAVYASAKLLMFPSRGDAWGLVANEAAFCGTPVLGSPLAISSRRLVEAHGIGLMQPLDVAAWADAAHRIISTGDAWAPFADRRANVIDAFSLRRSVAALGQALEMARPSPKGVPATPAAVAGE